MNRNSRRFLAWLRTLALVFVIPLHIGAAEPAKPPLFELRLVRDSASADTELLTLTHRSATRGEAPQEPLNVEKKSLLDRSALKSAFAVKDPLTGQPQIQIEFTAAGGKQFAEATREHAGRRLAFVIDGKVVAAPRVLGQITGGKTVLTGAFTDEEAVELAARLSGRAAQ
jgi:preprotein translocase subunit SecD